MTVCYTSPEELSAVFDQIESILPIGWEIDQRSECIEVTWPTESPENLMIRVRATTEIVQEIADGLHTEVLRDVKLLNELIEKRTQELL